MVNSPFFAVNVYNTEDIVARVFVGSTQNGLEAVTSNGMEFVGWLDHVKTDSRVVIKPNFTFPFYKPGVSTSPAAIEAVIRVLARVTQNITMVESDGGANSWKAEDAFEGHDLPRLCGEYGVKAVNLTKGKKEDVTFALRSGDIKISLPSLLLHETDVLITMPVPKIHCMTVASLALKNQWGCLPEAARRFTYHSRFDELIVKLNQLLKPQLVIADCTHMITGNGPMFGDLVRPEMMVVSNNIGAFELAMLEIMGLSKLKIRHIVEAQRQGMVPNSLDGVQFNKDPGPWKKHEFHLERTFQNYIALVGFRSRLITWLGYESPLAGPLHTLLYLVTGGNPLQLAVDRRKQEVQP